MSKNSAIFTVTKVNGGTVTSFSKLFMAHRIINAIESSGVAIVDYLGSEQEGIVRYTLNTSLSNFNAQLNTSSQSGGELLVGILDATDGLAIGTHDLVDENGNDIVLADNARIWDGFYEVSTTFTSATDAATIAFGIETDDAAGIKAAVAINNGANPYDAGAPVAIIQDGTITNISEKTTAAGRKVQAVVATEALTAGVLRLVLEVKNIGA